MNLANKITVSRLALIPIMVIIIYVPIPVKPIFWSLGIKHILFACLFIIAAATDFLDGYIARKRNEITTFGKFLDPIADKVLVITGMLYLLQLSVAPGALSANNVHYYETGLFYGISMWMLVVVVFREFMVTGIRILAVEQGKVIAASKMGKIKTALTMIAIIIFLFNHFGGSYWIGTSVMILAVVVTAISGLDYLIKNKHIIFASK